MTQVNETDHGGVKESSSEREVAKRIETKTQEQLQEDFTKAKAQAAELRAHLDLEISRHQRIPDFDGKKDEKESRLGKAVSLKELIQNILYAGKKAPDKVPKPESESASVQEKTSKLIHELSSKVKVDDITEHNAPYMYGLLNAIQSGEVKSVDDLAGELKKLQILRSISPPAYNNIQNAFVEYARDTGGLSAQEADKKFGRHLQIEEAQQERLAMEDTQWEQSIWAPSSFTSYFNNTTDKELIRSLYSPEKFVDYYEKVKDEVVARKGSIVQGKNRNSDEVAMEASKEMEVRISLLFGKLYMKLDHEKPHQFFENIEQEDIMRGIMPVKSELKRRISRLAQDLHHYEHELEKQGKHIHFFRRLEEDTETVAIKVDGKLKPRPRLKTILTPTKSGGGEFAHYLDQVVDHYIEARKYTHNSRAIFLHPPDAQKGFYGQLAHFAAGMSQLDFDQMMLLPDNDIFQSAFGLYNKMIEEGFAKNDWRHSTTMFTQKENENLTQIEKKVLDQLRAMYPDRHAIGEERLEAALTMAVGASRGMFLTEVEMAAFADPHLTESGGATFASYYNQDNSALNALNPMHTVFRFHGGPNMLDPIYFLPIKDLMNPKGFQDHAVLWEKAKAFKESFVKGRKSLNGEKTFADMLSNIGLVGGPMQRKGWRTAWQLESLYINDIGKDGEQITNHVKTFQHLENIGYEVLQDYITKLDGGFASARDKFGLNDAQKKVVSQKRELLEYIYKKYFNGEPKDLGRYLDTIRAQKTDETLKKIKKGDISPADIRGHVEGEVTKAFLDRALARVIVQRLPSKILRMDRDRFSDNGQSRWRKVMSEMGLEGKVDGFDVFDAIMQDVILAEQLLRKEVSGEMNKMREAKMSGENYSRIEYKMTADKLRALLAAKNIPKDRIDNAVKLYNITAKLYFTDAFIDKELVKYFKNGAARDKETKFTVALDETDLSFIPFRGGGQSVLKRCIGDIATVEEKIAKPLSQLVGKLRDMAINGKKDFSPIIEIIQSAYGAMDGIINTDYAQEVASRLAAMTIMYMKKDTRARALMGVFGIGRYNSMAAESAGRKTGVWEWDSREIDRFIFALEAKGLVPNTPFNISETPAYEPVYLRLPFTKQPIPLPEKIPLSKIADLLGGKDGTFQLFGKTFSIKDIPLFRRQKRNFTVWSKQLRENYGGTKSDIVFDIVNKYLPIVVIFILISLIKKAFEESEGKKK